MDAWTNWLLSGDRFVRACSYIIIMLPLHPFFVVDRVHTLEPISLCKGNRYLYCVVTCPLLGTAGQQEHIVGGHVWHKVLPATGNSYHVSLGKT